MSLNQRMVAPYLTTQISKIQIKNIIIGSLIKSSIINMPIMVLLTKEKQSKKEII